MKVLNWIVIILVIVGAVNWGLVGLFGLDLVAVIFGTAALAKLIYILVGLSGLYLIGLAKKLA
jgi:hypothetical protein